MAFAAGSYTMERFLDIVQHILCITMEKQLIKKLEDRITDYRQTHQGNTPLYILVSPDDEDSLFNALKENLGLKGNEVITTFKGSKIVGHDSVHPGDMTPTNELPESGS